MIKRSGVLFYDLNKKMVLLVETYGTKWGPAKGTREPRETILNCAQREAYEETGIFVTENQLRSADIWTGYRSMIYYVPMRHDFKSEYIPDDTTEITDIKWVHIDDTESLTLNCYGRCTIRHFKNLVESNAIKAS